MWIGLLAVTPSKQGIACTLHPRNAVVDMELRTIVYV